MPNDMQSDGELAAQVATLRRQVERLKTFKRRCRRAEAALSGFEERNRMLGDSTPLGIFTIDALGRITGINRKMQEIFAWLSVDEPQSANLFDGRRPLVADIVADIRSCIARQAPVVADHPCDDRDGARLHLRCHMSPVFTGDDVVGSVMAVVEDVSDLKKAEEALRESEKRYRQLFQSAPIALIEWDVSGLKAYLEKLHASGVDDLGAYLDRHPRQVHHCWSLIKTVDYNQAFLDFMGVAGSPGANEAFLPTDSGLFLKMAREIILAAAAGKTTEEREQTLVTTAGEPKIVLGRALAVSGHENTLERVAIALIDITQRKKAEEALRESERRFREQSLRDGLTGLYNQRYLYRSLSQWIDRETAAADPVSLIFMDLDRFKHVVDTHGHLHGSRAIQKVARTIDSCLEEPAFAVAYAGDEFVMVLPGANHREALEKADEIRSKIKGTPYSLDQGIEIRITASFGVATFPQHAHDVNGLIAAADQALFGVKVSGKDAVGPFRSEG
ncbi:MAG TPA: diguanylate cyclase [Desulfosarcina sp.]|nr:diguanylate cyclase [Desulfosarcina sp.]